MVTSLSTLENTTYARSSQHRYKPRGRPGGPDRLKEEDDDFYDHVLTASVEEKLTVPAAITLEKLGQEKESDEFCAAVCDKINRGDAVSCAPSPSWGASKRLIAEAPQVVVLKALQHRVFTQAHHSTLGAHLGG